MAGGQQEILGRHIYECDVQNINGIIIPTDMIQRENLQVFVKNGNTEIASAYTDENGVFDIDYFLSAASSPYDLTTKCGNVTAPIDTSDNTLSVLACSLTLTSDKNILSYIDGESATISATLKGTYTNELLSDREITFEVKKNNDIISRETVKTNSSGVAEITYNSKGLGDVSVAAYIGMLSTEIYIEDCVQYNVTGCSFTSNSDTDRVEATGLESFEYTPSSKFELSFDIDDTSQFKRFYLVSKPQSTSTSNRYGIGANFQSNTNKIGMVVRTTSSDEQGVSYTPPRPVNVKFVIDGTTTTGYVDGKLAVTKTISWWDTYAPYIFKWGIWGSGTATVTNIKVKAL